MSKHPLHYERQEIGEIMFKPLKIEIKGLHSDELIEIIYGEIVSFNYDANISFKPTLISIQDSKGNIRTFNIFEINSFSEA